MEGIDINAPPAFDIGTRVTCPYLHVSEDNAVVGHYVTLREGLVGPYRVRLDDGAIVYNKEAFFKKIGAPMEIQFKIGSRIECKLGTSDEWFPGVVIECFEKFAELDKPPYLIRFDYATTPGEHNGVSRCLLLDLSNFLLDLANVYEAKGIMEWKLATEESLSLTNYLMMVSQE